MATTSLAPAFYLKFTDSNGNPLALGQLWTYAAGTTTPLATFTDATGGTAAANPIILDANGQCQLWLSDAPYKLNLLDSTGAQQPKFPIDNVTSAKGLVNAANVTVLADLANATDAAKGDALVGFAQPYTGAQPQTVHDALKPYINVTQFMTPAMLASPSTVDCSAAFHAAFATGRQVYAPAGTYMVNLSMESNYMLDGDGFRRTVLIPVAGATSVVLIDASSSARQNVCLSNLAVKNPNNVANCAGIWFKGDNVNDINDMHNITNVEIGPVGWEGTTYAFAKGVRVTGRLISLTAVNLFVSGNTIGWHSVTDPATYAFNGNVFVNCVFQNSVQQGFLHTGPSTNANFVGGYFQLNNSANAAGVAGCDISDPINWTFDCCGFENNGSGVAVNASTPMSNSISLLVQGSNCVGLMVRGGYFTGSGANFVMGASLNNVVGGRIENNLLSCLSTGFNIATLAQLGSMYAGTPMILGQNSLNGKVSIYSAGFGQQMVAQQCNGMGYLTTAQSLDLLQISTIVTNPSVTLAITTVANMIPGAELVIMNVFGSASVTIAGSLMQGGALATVTTGTTGRFKVLGAPFPGLFYRIQ